MRERSRRQLQKACVGDCRLIEIEDSEIGEFAEVNQSGIGNRAAFQDENFQLLQILDRSEAVIGNERASQKIEFHKIWKFGDFGETGIVHCTTVEVALGDAGAELLGKRSQGLQGR